MSGERATAPAEAILSGGATPAAAVVVPATTSANRDPGPRSSVLHPHNAKAIARAGSNPQARFLICLGFSPECG